MDSVKEEITIRPVRAEDEAALASLIEAVDSLHFAGAPHVFVDPALTPRTGIVNAVDQRSATRETLVAEAEDAVVGFVRASIRASGAPIAAERLLQIEELVVAETHQRRGVGRQLVEAIEAWGRAQGASQTWLNVWLFNATARTFYESLGFSPMSIRMMRPLPPGARHDREN